MKNFDITKRGILCETVTAAKVFTNIVPVGWSLVGVYTHNHTASAAQVSFGYTQHGVTVASGVAVAASVTVYTAVNKPNYGSSPQSIYINTNSASDTFNSCTLDVTFVIEQYKPIF